ncbi:MAG: hypothetical protein K6G88_08575 [Lachnospiraceae bacterium]|nr:hypothetical protein [Lachnospiraceae bacterium]
MKINLTTKIKIKIINIIEKIMCKMGKRFSYETVTGIKVLNPFFIDAEEYVTGECEIDPKKLLLGIDFLNDDNTLIGINIIKSPHYSLMKSLYKGENIEGNEYIERMKRGALDERRPIIGYLSDNYFEKTFVKVLNLLQNKGCEPIYIYEIDGRMFILDGKHRAATASLIGTSSVKCKIVSSEGIKKSISNESLEIMKKTGKYSKHLELLNNLSREKDRG